MIDSSRLKAIMRKRGLSQAELARRVDVSPAAIQQLANGRSKSSRAIRRIANALEVSVAWLEGDTDDEQTDFVNEKLTFDDVEQEIVLYYTLNRQDGPIRILNNKGVLFSKFWLRKISGGRSNREVQLFAVDDNSMAPFILKGDDVLLAEQENYAPDPDAVWAFVYEGGTFLRRLRPTAMGRVSVDADNPQISSFEVSIDDLAFYGKAVWIGRKLGP